ncbi:putative membrane protein YdgH [Rubripirellula obstinata]|uniref:Putative membrane protein YdgH n=1 Tax=Rubripirellula obstinata TaxID=406547 RepID=A0A5B1CNR5_9BACT|nr:MMPL family transporter [Rubripirellula obstinata]KAA1260914.1 putative membrane protein YdgH [Rubripirellula obstinata]
MPLKFQHRSLPNRWVQWVIKHPILVVLAWVLLAVTLRVAAPNWKSVALDGDFEYLPAEMTSVAGGRLLDEAFPGERSRSQIVLVLARNKDKESASEFSKTDRTVGYDLLRRLYHNLGVVSWRRAIESGYQGGPIVADSSPEPWLNLAKDAFDASISADEKFYEQIADQVPDDEPTLTKPRMAIAYWDRGKLLESIGGFPEIVSKDFEAALVLKPDLPSVSVPIDERAIDPWRSMLDVLSWNDPVIGSQLRSDGARLAVMQLSSELAATGNIATVEAVKALVADVMDYSSRYTEPGIHLEITGSAATGGETLAAARDAIRYTELITVVMILVILAWVYRAPLLIVIPMVSIGVAVLVSTSLVALLSDWSMREVVPWLDMRLFTTSRIFIVVILFGAGTDYCLFLISRVREEAATADWLQACATSLSSVLGALVGSAMTTVVGLGMLWVAEFGKFHYTGPVIAICLLVGLLVCTTLTPALLALIGPASFWPAQIKPSHAPPVSLMGDRNSDSDSGGIWAVIALTLTRRPFLTLFSGLFLLCIPAAYGLKNEKSVTYDLSSQLSSNAGSRVGLRLLSEHFDIGKINPVTLLIVQPDDVDRKTLETQSKELAKQIYELEGVLTVRTADDPLGDFSPSQEMGLLSSAAWKRRALRNHRVSKRYFFSSVQPYENRLARLDVTMDGDPFSIETAATVTKLEQFLIKKTESESSDFSGATVLLAGTTPSIIDLRSVTLRDNRRIKIVVVLAVFLVLLLVIRRVLLCSYLIVTVLISYYATLGLTILFFRFAYGDDYVGLDWKLPLFLFVILVAIGQDYNVYLVTRIVEEERRLGWVAALRRAVMRTGSIITACGLVMAATFFSMTASAWLPPIAEAFGFTTSSNDAMLRGIVELGFALGLGVLIDTFYVRTILVPSFVAAIGKWRQSREKNRLREQATNASS